METLEIETSVGVTDTFELGETEVVMRSKKRRGIERRIPYWNISPNYIRRRPKGNQEIAKMSCFLFLVGLLGVAAVYVGWFMIVPAAIFMIPVYYYTKEIRNRGFDELVFEEDIDGGWAMTISFKPEDETRVLDFVAELQTRIKAYSDRRREERKSLEKDEDNA